MDGVLNLDKPAGMTSHDVVSRVRRVLGTKRAGHAGTLDPDAIGVLVVAVGQATRLLPHLPLEPKEYVARLALGVATDTEDASGRVVDEADAGHVDEAALAAALPRFVGEIEQVPPMVSALHHEGKRLYDLARQGVTVERAARRVVIHRVELCEFTPNATRPEATLRVVCGGGTYIRTLCADIGNALGVPAHMKSLVREAVGPFRRPDAVSLEQLAASGTACVLPMERALDVPLLPVGDEDAARLDQGKAVAAAHDIRDEATVGLTHRGTLCALARPADGDGLLHPFKVFARAEKEDDA